MAKSKKKRRQDVRDAKDARKFWQVVMISTAVLLLLLFLLYYQVT